MSGQALLLNATYEPLKIVSWEKAVTLIFQGKVEVVETFDREIHSVSMAMKMPSVIRLQRMVSFHQIRQMVRFSRETIFARDGYACQYCGKRFDKSDLTFDHVFPAARGGTKTWENIVTACKKCNHLKSGQTPDEAGMRLLKKAARPHWFPAILLHMSLRSEMPSSWSNYLFQSNYRERIFSAASSKESF